MTMNSTDDLSSAPPRRTIPLVIKRILCAAVIMLAAPQAARADGIFLEGGPGIVYSYHTYAGFVRYQIDTSPLFKQESFYELSYGYWGGDNHNQAAILARGIRLRLSDPNSYFSGEVGAGYVWNITENLGTHFQFMTRFAFHHQIEKVDLSIGYIHYSNGKLVLNWRGPNLSENFLTFQVGYLF